MPNLLLGPMVRSEDTHIAILIIFPIGAHSWVRKQFDISMDGEQSGGYLYQFEFSASSILADRIHLGCLGYGA